MLCQRTFSEIDRKRYYNIMMGSFALLGFFWGGDGGGGLKT